MPISIQAALVDALRPLAVLQGHDTACLESVVDDLLDRAHTIPADQWKSTLRRMLGMFIANACSEATRSAIRLSYSTDE